ncbi:MAG: DUF4384 domain-containing protein, partial [Desulfovibrio sp.]
MIMMDKRFFALLSLAVLLTFLASMAIAAERQTRDLVFEEEEPVAAEAAAEEAGMEDAFVISLRTTIELTRGEETTMVLPSHEFQSGDQIRFVYTTNIDGYVYWLAEGSTGSYQMLFPSERAGLDNAIVMNEEYTIPTNDGHWTFDENPGTENILVIVSTQPIPELEEAAGISTVTEENEQNRQTRDLVFEEEADEE